MLKYQLVVHLNKKDVSYNVERKKLLMNHVFRYGQRHMLDLEKKINKKKIIKANELIH